MIPASGDLCYRLLILECVTCTFVDRVTLLIDEFYFSFFVRMYDLLSTSVEIYAIPRDVAVTWLLRTFKLIRDVD